MFSKAFLHSGHSPTRPIELRAGPLSLRFEPDTAFLRHIRLGDHEVARAIYAAVRHHDWATIPPQVTITAQEIRKDSFRIAFDVRCRKGPVDFSWKGIVTGDRKGRIQYSFDGVANSDFLRNRIGICILHPIDTCRGKPVTIEHPDGSTEKGVFPDYIAPHQPFFDIRRLSYKVANTGMAARFQMTGDIFEMEDQRNWSDASFKTYCTPLSRPLPHPVKKGDRVQQSVTLELGGKVRTIPSRLAGRAPVLSPAAKNAVSLPPMGLCVASHGRPLNAREIERLKMLRLSHLRVDLRLSDAAAPERLAQAWNEARSLGTRLHVALEVGTKSERQLREFAAQLEGIQPRVGLWIILHESENPASVATVKQVRAMLKNSARGASFAAGTRDFFTEINRSRPARNAGTHVCYSNNPQVHAFDNTTLVENLAGLVYNVESARQFIAKPVVVSPITLRIRATSQAAGERPGALAELPADVDPRQLSLFGAGWTLGSISKLAETEFVHSLTYYETNAWRGLIESETGSPLPSKFPSEPGVVFPVYHLFADIGEIHAARVIPTHSSHPLAVQGLTLRDSRGRRRILAANLTGDPVLAQVKTGKCKARVRYLDETTAESAVRRPEEFRRQPGELKGSTAGMIELNLLPFSIARMDID